MSFRKRIHEAAGRFNERMAEHAGIEVVRNFGEVAEDLISGVRMVVSLKVRRNETYVWPEIEVTTHHSRRVTVNRIGILFSSVGEMRNCFVALTEDPSAAIDERPQNPDIDRPPLFDRVLSWLVCGASDYRLIVDHRIDKRHRFRAFAFRMRGDKRGVNLMVDNSSTGRLQQQSIAVFASTFRKCAQLLANADFQENS